MDERAIGAPNSRLHILDCGADQGRNLVDSEFASRHHVYKFVDNLVRELQRCLTVEFEEYRSSEPPETFAEQPTWSRGRDKHPHRTQCLWSGSGRTEMAKGEVRSRTYSLRVRVVGHPCRPPPSHNGAMTKSPDHRSVRVEIDEDAWLTTDAPLVVAGPERPRFRVAGLLAAIGFVAVLVLTAALFNDGDADDAAGPFPSVVPEVLDGGASGGLFSSDAATPAVLFQPTDGARQLESVVRSPSGFLGLTSKRDVQNNPVIVESVDGVQWLAIDFSVSGSVPPQPAGESTRIFESLRRIDGGYALLMTTSSLGVEAGGSPSTSEVRRLRSPDGMSWTVDEEFAPIDSVGQRSRAVAHGEDSFIIVKTPVSARSESLGDLESNQLDGDSNSEDACRSTEPTFWIASRGGARLELEGATSLLSPPLIADDGRVVGIDSPSSTRPGRDACEGSFDLEEVEAHTVVVWDPQDPTRPIRHPLPAEVGLTSLLSVGAEPSLSGDELLILVGSGLTSVDLASVDLDTGVWEDVLTLPVRPDDETSVQLTADGSKLVYLDSARVTVIGRDSGQLSFADSLAGNRPGFPQIIYADNEVVFARGANSIFSIDLPTS